MRKLRLLVLASYFSLIALGQEGGRNTVGIGAGGGFPSGGYLTDGFYNAPAFSASYEYRVFRFLAPEVAVVNMLPNLLNGSEFGNYITRERVTLLTLGLRVVAPLVHHRVELFAGAGAAHVSSSYYELNGGLFSPDWLLQLDGGGRAALGRRHRFWIGPTLRFYRDGGRPTEEWVSLTADFGFRF